MINIIMRGIFLILISTISLASFSQCSENMPIWLLGKWQIQNESGVSYEEWTSNNDTLMVGRIFSLYGKDTLELDKMMIVCRKGNPVFYMFASVNNRNIIAEFTIDKHSNGKVWTFSNPDAVFPHTFTYLHATEDESFVSFESIDPHEACTDFKMIRISR